MKVLMTAAVVATIALPATASAFHTVDIFSELAAVGGANNVYYTGSPRFRRWDCTACHLDSPGKLLLNFSSDPSSLLTERAYEPDTIYSITVSFRPGTETKGLDSKANFNSFALEIIDGELTPTGTFFDFDENLLRVTPGRDAIIARGQKNLDISSWTFKWGAPPAGRGFVDLYVAAVDGDGAGSKTTQQGDPVNDDVVTGVLRLAEKGQPAPPLPELVPTEAGCTSVPWQDGALMLLLPGLFLLRRRR